MSTAQLDTKYNWNTLEKKWYSYWLSKNYFHADENSSKETFTIVIPPPNVTGKLTMGHVLNNTIQDILIRKARMEEKILAGYLERIMPPLLQKLKLYQC